MRSLLQDSCLDASGLSLADIMSRDVVVIPADATMDRAARILADHDISGAPVVDGQGHCVGALSATDFVTYELDRSDELPSHGRNYNASNGEYIPWNSVRRFMATAVQTAAENDGLLHAVAVMCGEHIHRLIVLDGQSRPMGVVSTLDVMAAVARLPLEPRESTVIVRQASGATCVEAM